jgi:hypothetical protein
MIDTSNWNYYYKLNTNGVPHSSNLLYTPTVNPEGTVMCMHYCNDPIYRSDEDAQIGEDLIQWFFEREIKFLNKFIHLDTTPEVYDVDHANRKVYIEWNKETLSQILFTPGRILDNELPDWQEQIKSFLVATKENNFWKMALYPHCFYISKNGKLKTIDMYSVVPYEERYIERKIIEGVIGKHGAYRFDQSTDDNGYIDFKKFFEITVTKHLSMTWPYYIFRDAFEEIYNDRLE